MSCFLEASAPPITRLIDKNQLPTPATISCDQLLPSSISHCYISNDQTDKTSSQFQWQFLVIVIFLSWILQFGSSDHYFYFFHWTLYVTLPSEYFQQLQLIPILHHQTVPLLEKSRESKKDMRGGISFNSDFLGEVEGFILWAFNTERSIWRCRFFGWLRNFIKLPLGV